MANLKADEIVEKLFELPIPHKKLKETVNEINKRFYEKVKQESRIIFDWDQYFMSIACLAALASKDKSSPVGACIVSPNRTVVGIGYNAMPNDKEFPMTGREDGDFETTHYDTERKFLYIVHAAVNAIINKTIPSLEGCTIYTTMPPDRDCAHAIIQSGIKVVKYAIFHNKDDTKLSGTPETQHVTEDRTKKPDIKDAMQLLQQSDVLLIPFGKDKPKEPQVTITIAKKLTKESPEFIVPKEDTVSKVGTATEEGMVTKVVTVTKEDMVTKVVTVTKEGTGSKEVTETKEGSVSKVVKEIKSEVDTVTNEGTVTKVVIVTKVDTESKEVTEEVTVTKVVSLSERIKTKKDDVHVNALELPELFMSLALLAAKKQGHHERCHSATQGACIVDTSCNKILSIGHSGYPEIVNQKAIERGGDSDGQNHFITHAEYKAILARGAPSFRDCTLYVTKHPCNGCAQVIVQSRIKEVYYIKEGTEEGADVTPVEFDSLDKTSETWEDDTKRNIYCASKKILKDSVTTKQWKEEMKKTIKVKIIDCADK